MLTKRQIDAAKYEGEGRSRFVIWDTDPRGLGLRVYPPLGGKPSKKAFVLSFRAGSRKRLLTLGDYGTLTLDQARQDARERLREVKREGRDPMAERKAGRLAETVSELIGLYIERHAKPRKRSWKEDARVLGWDDADRSVRMEGDVAPRLGHLKIKEVRRADIVDLLDLIVLRAPVAAARTFEVVRKMFNFAIERSLLEQSPCHRVPAPAKAKTRSRVLTPDEIRALWAGIDNDDLPYPKDKKNGHSQGVSRSLRLAMRILLLTAKRRGELAKAKFENIDLVKGLWVIPREDAKNDLWHRVPLSSDAREAFKELRQIGIEQAKRRAEANEETYREPAWVLPNVRGDSHIKPGSITHAYGRLCKAVKLTGVTVHDLRRSAATGFAEAKTPRLVIAKLLNHADKGVTAIYERYEYADEMRAAVDKWARQVRKIIAERGHVKS